MRKSRGQEMADVQDTLEMLKITARMGTVTAVSRGNKTARVSWSDGKQSGPLRILQSRSKWTPEIGSTVVSLHRVDGSGWILGGYEGTEAGEDIESITNAEIDELTKGWGSGDDEPTTAGMNHALTTHRDAPDSHPISAITMLEENLGGKISGSDRITNMELLDILSS